MEIKKYATINYLLSEKGRKVHILKGGNGVRLQSLNVEVNETIINLAEVSEYGEIEINIGFEKNGNSNGKFKTIVTDYKTDYGFANISCTIEGVLSFIEFDIVMESQELIEFEVKRIEELKIKKEKVLIEVKEKQKLKEENIAETNRIRKEQERVQEEKYIKEKKEMEEEYNKIREEKEKKIIEWKTERDLWIKENGSNYLIDSIELGYNVDNSYITERKDKELPQFQIDFKEYLDYEEIEDPSEDAINTVKRYIEQGYDAEIVRIIRMTDGQRCNCEGIIIRRYLDRYFIAMSFED
ncbi:MAG: hypothetical protein ACRCW0_08180 [Clostridium sp.]